jgi:ribosome-associated protein
MIEPPDQIGGIELAPGVWATAPAMRLQYSRSSGPGGQNVNKVNTKAELWIAVSDLRGLAPDALARLRELAGSRLTTSDEIHIASDTHRTQEANRQAALDRLRELLVRAKHRPKSRRRTKPSAASRRRRLEAKKHRGTVKAGRRSAGDE